MSPKISLIFLLVTLIFAMACGGGGGGNSSDSTATVEGTLDFSDTSLSKPRLSATSGNVVLTNLETNESYTVSFSGTTFGANVAPGDYIIEATRNDGKYLQAYQENVSRSASNRPNVDIDSTVVAQWIDLYELEVSQLSEVKTLFEGSSNTLTSSNTSISDNDRQNALAILSLKKRLQSDLGNNINILSDDYDLSGNAITSFSTNVTLEIVAAGNSVILSSATTVPAGTTTIDITGSDNNFNPSDFIFDFDEILSNEKVIVIGSQFPTGALSTIDVETLSLSQNHVAYEVSDLEVFVDKRKAYVLGRFSADFFERYDAANFGKSTLKAPYDTLSSSETNSLNPQSLLFGPRNRALLTRYGSSKQWIVNPNARREADFFQSEIDLSDYADSDNIPEFSAGVYVSGNYYIAAQRLDRNNFWVASNESYMAVIDSSGNEINTNTSSSSNLNGIALPARNPLNMVYSEDLDKIFIACVGQYGSSFSGTDRVFTGGIVTLDPHDFSTELLIDDDAGANASSNVRVGGGTYDGLITNVAVVNETKGYIVIYSEFGKNDLRSFNPTTGLVGGVISGFSEVNIGDMALDSQDRLWVIANSTSDSAIKVLDTTTDLVVDTVGGFDLPPSKIDIIRY